VGCVPRSDQAPDGATDAAPLPPLRLCGLNHRRLAAKITESRKRTLFPSDEAAEPIRPRRTVSPPDKPSHHASVSGSVSRAHGEEPGSITRSRKGREEGWDSARCQPDVSTCALAAATGAEHRQTIAHGVSRGLRSQIGSSPGRGDRCRPTSPFEALRLGGFVSPVFPQKEYGRKSRQASKPPRRRDLPRGSERRTERPLFFASSREISFRTRRHRK
jgi:hypothetical protein